VREIRPLPTGLSDQHEPEIADINRETNCSAASIALFYPQTWASRTRPRNLPVVLRRIACLPGESVFVDDKRVNADAARDVGMQTIHFRTHPIEAGATCASRWILTTVLGLWCWTP